MMCPSCNQRSQTERVQHGTIVSVTYAGWMRSILTHSTGASLIESEGSGTGEAIWLSTELLRRLYPRRSLMAESWTETGTGL